ncbi:MAG TPA: TetR/AcrR family transcriptional regulator [Chloroflexota bacterium]|jgi:AcrR family transcriptional regulator|nr:TetR/AcrR family transcriptional regulator [Chloroflexota bacterium]
MKQVVPRGRRADALANHARILAAARSLLAERGLDLEVDAVAARAGVGVGTLYSHFTNRDNLVRAVLTQTLDEAMSRFRAAAAIEDPVEALRQIPLACAVDESLFVVFRDPRSSKLQTEITEQRNDVGEELYGMVEGILERGIRAGAFRPDLDPRITAAAILGSIGGVVETRSMERPMDELVRALADLHSRMVAAC